MSRKPARGSRSQVAAISAEDGIVATFIDRVFENPAMLGGLMVVALTATAIVSNAMFLQSGHHPDPLFMTRPTAPAPVARVAPRPVAAPVPRPRPDAVIVVPPLPRLAPHAEQALPAVTPPAPVPDTTQLITAIQRELARLGLYSGAIDGITGSRTATAISAYESAAGLAPTGVPTPELLAAMKVPLPPRTGPASLATSADSAAAAAELDRREQAREEAIAAEQRTRAEALLRENYRIVQGALNRIGYGPIAVDGAASAETADAIRRFELDNGLPVSGEAGDAVIGRLMAIGAIKAT